MKLGIKSDFFSFIVTATQNYNSMDFKSLLGHFEVMQVT